jgi:hypothetical protein
MYPNVFAGVTESVFRGRFGLCLVGLSDQTVRVVLSSRLAYNQGF